jgi:hypothetical protein
MESFPYKKEFLNLEELWNNAVTLDLVTLRVLDIPTINTNRPKSWWSLPRNMNWEFQGKLTAFVVHSDAYEKVNKLVDYFSEEARMKSNRKGHPSPYDYYQQNYQTVVAKANEMTTDLQNQLPFRHYLREAVYKLVPECTTFKISVTKALFKYLGSKMVLDPSSGWGDRLLGAAAAGVESYHGIDPNISLRSCYDDMLKFIKKENYFVLTEDFLKVNFDPESYDTVFTSPPYFDYEIYSNDSKQSIIGRSSVEIWTKEFLYPYLRKAWNALITGGYFAIYISDTKTGKYVMNMYNFITKTLKGNFLGVIAITPEDLDHAYPIWIWRK